MRTQCLSICILLSTHHLIAEDWGAAVRCAQALEHEGKLPQAADVLRTWLSRPGSSDPSQRAVTWNNLGALRQQMHDYADAERCYWRAVGTLRDAGRTFATAINNLAAMYAEVGEYSKLQKLDLERMLARLEPEDRQSTDYARLLENIGDMHLAQGKHEEAERLQQRAVNVWQALSPGSPQEAAAWNRLGLCHHKMRRDAEAETEFRNAATLYFRLGRVHTARLAMVQVNLASLYLGSAKAAAAGELFRKALDAAESTYGPESLEAWQVLANYAAALRKAGRKGDAAPLQERADAIRRQGGLPRLGISVDVAEFRTLGK